MSNAHVSINIRKVDDKTSVIAMTGELSAVDEPALMEAYMQACTANVTAPGDATLVFPTTIIFNFDELDYLNSSGIGLLITLLLRMRRQRQRMCVVGLSEHIQHVFAVTRLDAAIPIFDTEADALAVAAELAE
jgi:anti-sigma B factor antagonist